MTLKSKIWVLLTLHLISDPSILQLIVLVVAYLLICYFGAPVGGMLKEGPLKVCAFHPKYCTRLLSLHFFLHYHKQAFSLFHIHSEHAD